MQKIFEKFFIIIFFIIAILFMASMASTSLLKLIITAMSMIILSIGVWMIKKRKIRFNKKICFIIIVVGLLLRVGIFFFNYNIPLQSDYLFFYENATNFAQGQELNNRYIATFPYLASYTILLGLVFKIFNSNNYMIVILLNSIIDIFTSIVIYNILKQEDKQKGIIATTLWLINPINITWNMICCPVVVVNFGIVCTIYMFDMIRKLLNSSDIKWIKFWTLNVIYGSVIGIFNIFRPIMIIMVIATLIYYIYRIIKDYRKKILNILLGVILVFITYKSVNLFSNFLISKLINQEVSTTPGWTLYVGSNLEKTGMWNLEDSSQYSKLFDNKELTAEDLQQKFKEKAIERYKNNGADNLNLFMQKFKVLTSSLAEYSYANIIITATLELRILIVIIIYLAISMIITVLLNIYLVQYIFNDSKKFESTFIYMLLLIGIILSHLFVEVSPRYSLPIMPMLIIIATYTISNIIEKDIRVLK